MARKPSKKGRPLSKDDIKAKAERAAKRSKGEPVEKEEEHSVLNPPSVIPRGRPTKYTPEIADEICRRMSEGQTLNTICSDPRMPSRPTVLRWKNADVDGFLDRFTRAREDLIDHWEDELMDVADDGRNDYVERMSKSGETYTAFSKENVERSKLRVDARKWMLSKLRQAKFGDKIEQTHKADEGFLMAWQMMSGQAPPKK